MIVIPSLVEPTALDLFTRIQFLFPYYHQFQVDIQDGKFTKNVTVKTRDVVDYILSTEKTSGIVVSTIFDFHLQVNDPESQLEQISKLPLECLGIILIHRSVFPDIKFLTTTYPHFKFGLVLNPNEEVADIPPVLLHEIFGLQLMTIYPGKQGQPFIQESLKKIEQLRKAGFQKKIYIDGAVNESTLPILKSLPNKPDVLCPGSYLAKSPKEELERRALLLASAW